MVPYAWLPLPVTLTDVPEVTVVLFTGAVMVAVGAGSPTPCRATLPMVAAFDVRETVWLAFPAAVGLKVYGRLQEPPARIELMELPLVQLGPPAENGAEGPPEIAADAALPVLLITTVVEPELCETETEPKLIEFGATESTGAGGGTTVSENTGLCALDPFSS